MAYVVTETCIKCKYGDCIEVCPQEAFREGINFVVIDPKACANCALCETVCPINAIFPDYNLPEGQKTFRELNASLAEKWPKAQYRPPPADADEWVSAPDKRKDLSKDAYSE